MTGASALTHHVLEVNNLRKVYGSDVVAVDLVSFHVGRNEIVGLLYNVNDLNARIEQLLDRFDLVPLRDRKCGVLSSGEATRVALAKAFLNRPTLLLLDEPTASLDPAAADDVRTRIRRYADEANVGILWTSHNMYEVEDVCHRVLFLSHGRILLEGDPKRLPIEHGHKTLEDLFIAVAREPLTLGAK